MRTFVAFLLFSSFALHGQAPKRPRITGIGHVAFGVTDMAKARDFYTGLLGYEEAFQLINPDGKLRLAFFKVNDAQFIELFPNVKPASDKLQHFAFTTDDAKGMRAYLASRGVRVPPSVRKGRIGDWSFIVDDPDRHGVEFRQYAAGSETMRVMGKHLGNRRISTRLRHVGILCGNLEASLRFYRDILGFREAWRGSNSGTELSWVNLQVPDGEDYIELMLYKKLPPPKERTSHHHVCLEVPDVEQAAALLKESPGRKGYKRAIETRVGTNRRRQLNLFDPDGTRIELMEPQTIDGKPAPPSTAPPPKRTRP